MPFAIVSSGRLHYRVDGIHDGPVLVLSNSLGTDLSMWDRQVAAMARDFQIIRYDSRGHGASLVTPGPYTIEMLARDVLNLLDHLEIAQAHFCGLSMGGMAGIWLAAHEPNRIGRLILANTAAVLGPREAWDARMEAVRAGGLATIANTVMERWFTPVFREEFPGDVEGARRTLLATPAEGYIACCSAIRDMDQRAVLTSIRARTLVIAGQHDPATPPELCKHLADSIPGARLTQLSAAHLSNIEAADSFNASVLDFLSS
jgi:3-oxoadipate enol-lactonase